MICHYHLELVPIADLYQAVVRCLVSRGFQVHDVGMSPHRPVILRATQNSTPQHEHDSKRLKNKVHKERHFENKIEASGALEREGTLLIWIRQLAEYVRRTGHRPSNG